MPEQPSTAAIVIIGNEILSGKVKDENSHYLCCELRDLGVEVRSIVTIPDDIEMIGEVVRQASEQYTWVFTSGGIGPTHDDLTVPSIAAGFQTPLVRSESLAKLISKYYGKEVNEAHLKMAMIPEGSELLFDESNRVTQVLFQNILIFPGIPRLLQRRFQTFRERFRSNPIYLHQIFLNCDEGQIAHLLDQTLTTYPEIQLGSYPRTKDEEKYEVKLTLESREAAYLQIAATYLLERIPSHFILRNESPT
jgi:molybdenum cofactor synthesis domain-containing protein